MIQTMLSSKLWAEIDQSVIYLTNILSTSTELYSELVENSITSYETWHEVSYSHSKILRMIRMKAVVHKEDSELKKAEKLLEHDKKMILVRYRDQSIYQLYDRESDSVVVSESVDFNEDLLTDENIKDSITDQSSIFKIEFFIEFFIKFFNKDNKKIFNSSDLMSESVRDKAEAKKNTMKISSSQKEMLIMRCERSKKKTALVNRVILSVKILEWEELIDRKSESLTLLFLTKLDLDLYINSNIWLRPARDLKVYCLSVTQQQQIDINEIQISKTYQQAMKSSQRDE